MTFDEVGEGRLRQLCAILAAQARRLHREGGGRILLEVVVDGSGRLSRDSRVTVETRPFKGQVDGGRAAGET